MAFLFRCLVFACFAIARTISYDNEVAFEGLNTLLKKTPIAPAKLCISNLAKFVGPGETSPQEALGAYLGRGYDPLTDKTKFSVFDDSYANCNVSVDNKYIVPDFYRTELLKEGNCDKSTQVYSTYKEYQTSEESGIGAKGQGSKSGITLGGSFSKSSQETKTNMEKQERSLILMKLWYKKYRFEADIGAKFSHAFGDRIQAVTTAFKNGLKRMTRYLVEEIYRDYGTHVVNSAVLGVQLERRVFISSSVMSASKEKADSFKLGVSGSMRKEDKSGGGSYGQKDTSTSNSRDELSQIDRKDFISVLGGPNYKDLASDNVEDLLKDVNLAALSRDTTPIYKMINFATLQGYNLTQTDIETIQNLFREVYNELLERNMHPGCTDREYYNFDFQANTDDATCDSPRCQWKDIGLQCNEDKGATCREQEYQNQLKYEVPDMSEAKRVLVLSDGFDEQIKISKTQKDKSTLLMKGYAWQKCEDGPKSVKVDKNFFKEATTREFQECFKNHHVEFDGKTLREKQCNVTVSTLWSKSPKITGFFQKCTPRQPTSDFDTELAMIKQSRTPACERHNLEVMNLETNTLKCPSGTNETLMKEYDHTLPDYAIDFECLTHKITVILKDVVTISTYWCKPNDPNQPNGLLYGGFYRRGRPNSYIGTEGCGDNMREAKLFHDTTLCVHNDITNKDLKNTAELRSIIGRNGERVNCGSKESKIFLSTINGEKMYACIYKKGGYFNAPSIAPVTLPFNDYLDMFEAHSKNVIIVDGKVTVLTRARDLSNIFGDKCDSQNIVMPSTSTDASEAKADKGPSIFDPTLIPILIVAVLVIVGFLVVKKVLPNNHVPLR